MFHTTDHDHHLIQVQFVGRFPARSSDPVRHLSPKRSHPGPGRFVTHDDPAGLLAIYVNIHESPAGQLLAFPNLKVKRIEPALRVVAF